MLQIVANIRSPNLSAAIANTYAATYLDFSRERKANLMQHADAMLGEHLSGLPRRPQNLNGSPRVPPG